MDLETEFEDEELQKQETCDPINLDKVSSRKYITNNRFAAMMLRMCFHDNAINATYPDFQMYIHHMIDPLTKEFSPPPNNILDTSGLDASIFLSIPERIHPNQNYDQTASRIVLALLTEDVLNVMDEYGHSISMMHKYKLSWSDFLANGCKAAYSWLTQSYYEEKGHPQYPQRGVLYNYAIENFDFGRHDACYVKFQEHITVKSDPDNTTDLFDFDAQEAITDQHSPDYPCRVALHGPTDNLPGALMSGKNLGHWFSKRGMSACLWLALMGTHTTLDNLGLYGAISHLPYKTSYVDELLFQDMTPKQVLYNYKKKTQSLYFKTGQKLDYFKHFLYNGSCDQLKCKPNPKGELSCSCHWHPQTPWNGKKPVQIWPLGPPDCTLAYSNLMLEHGTEDLRRWVEKFGHGYDWIGFPLKCAIQVLTGFGESVTDDCYHLPCFGYNSECIENSYDENGHENGDEKPWWGGRWGDYHDVNYAGIYGDDGGHMFGAYWDKNYVV